MKEELIGCEMGDGHYHIFFKAYFCEIETNDGDQDLNTACRLS